MNKMNNTPLVVAFIIVIILFLVFGSGAMTGRMMNENMHENGWIGDRSWMWFPALITLVLSIGLGWVIFRKGN